MKQLYLLVTCALISLLLSSPAVLAANTNEAIGTVVAVRGPVDAVSASGRERRLVLKSPVYRDDTIRTENSRIQIMFSDNTLISLGRKTQMVLTEYKWRPGGKTGVWRTKIKEGTFRVLGGAIAKAAPQNFKTQTPAATIGIRGSMYAGKATPTTLMVVFQGGKGIDVTNAAGTVGITKPGYGTRVLGLHRPPLPPVKFTAKELSEVNVGLGQSGGNKQKGKKEGTAQKKNKGESKSKKNNSPAQEGEKSTSKSQQTAKNGTEKSGQASGNAGQTSTADNGGSGATSTTTTTEQNSPTGTAAGTTSGVQTTDEGSQATSSTTDTSTQSLDTSTTTSSTTSSTLTSSSLSSFADTSGTLTSTESTVSSPVSATTDTTTSVTQVTDLSTQIDTVTQTVNQTQQDQTTQTAQTAATTQATILSLSGEAFATAWAQLTPQEQSQLEPSLSPGQLSWITDSNGDGVVDALEPVFSLSGEAFATAWAQLTPQEQGQLKPSLSSDQLSWITDSDGDGVVDAIDADGRFLSVTSSSSFSSQGLKIDGILQNGTFTGTTTDQNGNSSTFTADLPAANPSGSYDAVFGTPYDHAMNSTPFALGKLSYDSLGQFVIFTGNVDNVAESYQEYGYAGILASSLPTSSVAIYTGPFQFVNDSQAYYYTGPMSVWVNFANGTAMGFVDGDHQNGQNQYFDGGLFYGKISGNELTNVHFMGVGSDYTTGQDIFHDLTGETGTFFGSAHQGFGWGGTGSTVFATTGGSAGSFEVMGAGFRGAQELTANMTDQHWKGYLAGMASPGATAAPLPLYNANGSADDLQINLNAAAGTVGGSLNLNGLPTGAIPFGSDASVPSAYIDPSWFFAALPNGSSTGAPVGGVMIPAKPWQQWSDYFTWGWWDLFYNDGTNYYTSTQWDNYWVAGNLTSDLNPAGLSSTLATTGSGTYLGQAYGVYYDISSANSSPYDDLAGPAKITVNFGANPTFTGSLDFSYQGGPKLAYSGSVGSNGLQANALKINGLSSTNSSFLNGNFYGANMEALAGNFGAELNPTTNSYIAGVFGGEASTPQAASVSGEYLGLMTPNDPSLSGEIWSGSISAQVQNGLLSGTANTVAASNGSSNPIPLSFFSANTAPSRAQNGAVTGWYSAPQDEMGSGNPAQRTVNLLGANQVFSGVKFQSFDPTQFSYFVQQNNPFGSSPNDGNFSELGFMGTPATSITATGVESFSGDSVTSGVFNNNLSTLSQGGGGWDMGVNWTSGKVVGEVSSGNPSQPGGTMYFFGNADKSTGKVSGVQVVGSTLISVPDPSGTGTISLPFGSKGTGTFGQFYGSGHQGFGATATGTLSDLSVSDPTTSVIGTGNWQVILAGFRDPKNMLPAPTGTSVQWQGFVVGLAEDVNNPDTNRKIFMNTVPTDFQLNIDPQTGALSGSMTAASILTASQTGGTLTATSGGSTSINGMGIGGTYGGAYVDNDHLAAVMGGGSTTIQDTASGNTTSPKPTGSYLVAKGSLDANGYASWGYWETAYVDPGTGNQYHVHQPGTMWVAGQRTPAATVQSLITGSFTGTYSGWAQGYRIDAVNHANDSPIYGQTNLTVNFSSKTVTGGFDFTQAANPMLSADKNLTLTNGVVTTSGFTANIQNAAASRVAGGFYGPKANAVGGTFGAAISGDGTYTGVFGGDLK